MTKIFTKSILISYFFLLIILFKLNIPTISEEIPLMQKNDYFNFSSIYAAIDNGRLALTGNLIRYISPNYFGFFFILNTLILFFLYYVFCFSKKKDSNQILNLFFIVFILSPSFSNIFLNIRNLEVLFILPLFIIFLIEYRFKNINFFNYFIYFILLNYLIYFKETIALSFIFYYLVLLFFAKLLPNKNFLFIGLFSCIIYSFIYFNVFTENYQKSLIIEGALAIDKSYFVQRFLIFLRYLYNDLILILFLIFFSFKLITLFIKGNYLELRNLFIISFCVAFLLIHIIIGIYGHYLIVLYPILIIVLMNYNVLKINPYFVFAIFYINLIFISMPSLINNINQNIYNRINFNSIVNKLIEENYNNEKKKITIIEDGSSFFQVYAFNEVLNYNKINNFNVQISNDECGKKLNQIDKRYIKTNIPKRINSIDDIIQKSYFDELPFSFIAPCEINEIKKSDFIIYLRKGIFTKQTINKVRNIENDDKFVSFNYDDGMKFDIEFLKNLIKDNFLTYKKSDYSSAEFVLFKKIK